MMARFVAEDRPHWSRLAGTTQIGSSHSSTGKLPGVDQERGRLLLRDLSQMAIDGDASAQFPLALSRYPEQPLDEGDLPDDISLCYPSHLALADHVHRFVSGDCP